MPAAPRVLVPVRPELVADADSDGDGVLLSVD